MDKLQINLVTDMSPENKYETDLDEIIFDLDTQIDLLSSQTDVLDCLVSIASGAMCAALDVLWVGNFNLERGRDIASSKVKDVVKSAAKMFGCKESDLESCIRFLEKRFPTPSDGNTPDFGGGLQHHLRDFAHHPTPVGLIFSLITQFTSKSYGTDAKGRFITVDVPECSKIFIGESVSEKIFNGTIIWFFHLVSDIAGSSGCVGINGGTGIPGPLLSLAKEISALPILEYMKIGNQPIHVLLTKLFNGTLFAKRDKNGAIIKESVLKFDLRGELGMGMELGRQALPVIANDSIVRAFYFIRHLALELKENVVYSFDDLEKISWDKVKPSDNPTITRMLTIATGVFTAIDIGEAVITQKYWISVNYVGVGRFAVAVGQDVAWCLKRRNIKKIKQMYKNIKNYTYMQEDERIYKRLDNDRMNMDKFELNVSQVEILYNLEYHKTYNDIQNKKIWFDNGLGKKLKQEWLDEWKDYISQGFSSFLQVKGAKIRWYSEQELVRKIKEKNPSGIWFRLVLLEAMLFEPYYPLNLDKDKKGNYIPSPKYERLQKAVYAYKKSEGDRYLDALFTGEYYYARGYVHRLRKCYDKVLRELNEVLKTTITSLTIVAIIAITTVVTAGALAPKIAVLLVGSNFTGLSGVALTNACLAYLGGGAIVVGGAGMAGGTAVIVGGGALLGIGIGTGVGGAVSAVELLDKKMIILQSAKLLVAVREIFLNDEKDVAYAESIDQKYIQNIMEIENNITKLRLQEDVLNSKEKREIKEKIKRAEENVKAMKIARKSMLKFRSSFEMG